jgi:ParB family chromosome partitioning protein
MTERALFGEITAIPLAEIDATDRLRPVDPAHVEAIAASIAQIGLTAPIVLRPDGNRFRLVAGAHRLEAVRTLGWESIDAIVENIEPDEARLVEIDENLMRRELSALDKALFFEERQAVYLRVFPEAKALGRKPKKIRQTLPNFGMSFAAHTAKRTGLSERTIRLSLEMVRNLHPEARDLLRLSDLADNQAQLLKLASMPAEEQVAVARAIVEGKARAPKQARLALGLDAMVAIEPGEKLFVAFLGLWARMDAATKRRVTAYVSDSTRKKASK